MLPEGSAQQTVLVPNAEFIYRANIYSRRAHGRRPLDGSQRSPPRDISPTNLVALELGHINLAAGHQNAKVNRQVKAAGIPGQIGRGELTVMRLLPGNSSSLFWMAGEGRGLCSVEISSVGLE